MWPSVALPLAEPTTVKKNYAGRAGHFAHRHPQVQHQGVRAVDGINVGLKKGIGQAILSTAIRASVCLRRSATGEKKEQMQPTG
jgi:hypothetical protein